MFLSCFQLAHVMCAAWGWGRHPPGIGAPLLLVLRCLAQVLATGFHRFLARFSGRRRPNGPFHQKSPPWTILVLVVFSCLFSIVDACSSRTTPKPRPPVPTPRPNITFHTYECPPAYASWYCMNMATCFTVKIGDSLLYNCECAEGFMGPRCEYKDLDGSYVTAQRRFMLEKASIAGGATIAVFLVVVLCTTAYLRYKRRTKVSRTCTDCVDGSGSSFPDGSGNYPTFGTRWRTTQQADLPIPTVHHPHSTPNKSLTELYQVTTLKSGQRQQQQQPAVP